ncbi:MAG: hypothetical protein V4760_15885 [Bdellovibrionota bacterium]
MDLSRLNMKSLTRLGRRYRNFREFLAQVLEGERSLVDPKAEIQNEEPEFARNDEVDRVTRELAKIASSGRATVPAVFAVLAPFFEVGFSLRRDGGALVLEQMFLLGRVFTPPGVREPEVDFGLVGEKVEGVLRGRVAPILREAELENFKTLMAADALAFEPATDRLFVLISDRPHPWQVGMIETVYLEARTALTSRGPVRPAPLRKFFR